jgi:hypothetical protein
MLYDKEGEPIDDSAVYRQQEDNPHAWQYIEKIHRYEFVLPEKFKCKGVRTKIIVSFFLGTIPLVILPAIMGPCDYANCHVSDRRVTGTSTAVVKPGYQLAFEDLISSKQLIKKAQYAEGHVNYAVIQDIDSQNRYQILETWANVDSWKSWTS